ncbi:hypothetical protein LCGC14_1475590 [marine sediment metagenome]|uniref:Enoyl reductase (ER) domain-containing protein n=1 Tax=marine sediment metagenome TaxID=412755 RepID=A0A0F9EWG2_9ZZZZ
MENEGNEIIEGKKMKAIVWTKYGPPDVLQLREVEKPTPKDNEVLIRIYATTVTAGECEVRNLNYPFFLRLISRIALGLRKPKKITILGQELAGEIEVVGKDVNLFRKGDHVFAATGFGFGADAEFICLPEEGMIAIKPVNINYEEAATVPIGGLTSLHLLRQANIQKGQKVLINGAGGSIGTMAAQLAKSFGAEVTIVGSTRKLDMLRSIGADHVFDFTQEDFTKSRVIFDVIFDVVGKGLLSRSKKSLKKNGFYLLANPKPLQKLRGRWIRMTSSKNVIFWSASEDPEELIFLKELIETGKIKTVIDKRYPLAQIAEAHSYVETGQKTGNVAISVE